MASGSELVGNIVRLTTTGLLLLAQAVWMYSLATMKPPSDRHRDDCPFSHPYRFSQETSIPSPEQCPYCVWNRIYTFNRAIAILGMALVAAALLTLVALAAQ